MAAPDTKKRRAPSRAPATSRRTADNAMVEIKKKDLQELLEALRIVDRSLRNAPAHAQRPGDARGTVALVRFCDAFRRLRDHRVDDVADPCEFVDDALRRLR